MPRIVAESDFFRSHVCITSYTSRNGNQSSTAMTSSSRITTYSVPSSLTSVPEYLPNRILSPFIYGQGPYLTIVQQLAVSDSDHLSLNRLLRCGVRDKDATCRFLVFL